MYNENENENENINEIFLRNIRNTRRRLNDIYSNRYSLTNNNTRRRRRSILIFELIYNLNDISNNYINEELINNINNHIRIQYSLIDEINNNDNNYEILIPQIESIETLDQPILESNDNPRSISNTSNTSNTSNINYDSNTSNTSNINYENIDINLNYENNEELFFPSTNLLRLLFRTYYENNNKKTLSEEEIENTIEYKTGMIECSICFNNFNNYTILKKCNHQFCQGCIKKWLLENAITCPICRTEVI